MYGGIIIHVKEGCKIKKYRSLLAKERQTIKSSIPVTGLGARMTANHKRHSVLVDKSIV